MNNLIPTNTATTVSSSESIMNALSQLDSKVLLSLTGMVCLTTIICVGFVSFSNSEMTLSKNGLSITQPIQKNIHAKMPVSVWHFLNSG